MRTTQNKYPKVSELLKEMHDQYSLMKQLYEDEVKETMGLKPEVLEALIRFTFEEITTTLSADEIKNFFNNYKLADNDKEPDEQNMRAFLYAAKKLSVTLYEMTQEMNKIYKETQDGLQEIEEEKMQAKKQEMQEQLQKLKEEAESDENADHREKIMNLISSMESAISMEFIFSRYATYGDKELKNVMEGFFDAKKGAYTIEKCINKMKLFGFDANLYKYFFNLEETFLDEKYHVFNNIFLYMYMRTVSYADPYNKEQKMYVQSLTQTLINLIYHKFPKTESEKNFVSQMERYVNLFMPYIDKFEADNTTAPKHPERIAADNKREAEMKVLLKNKCDENGFTDYDLEWSSKQFHEYFNTKLEEKIEADKKAKVIIEASENPSEEEPAETETKESVDASPVDEGNDASPEC